MCIMNGPPTKGHPANLTQLWEALASTRASIPMESFRHLVESMPRRIEVVPRAQWVQLNIRKVFLMFCTLSVFSYINIFVFRYHILYHKGTVFLPHQLSYQWLFSYSLSTSRSRPQHWRVDYSTSTSMRPTIFRL
jgi:hypothetical protein